MAKLTVDAVADLLKRAMVDYTGLDSVQREELQKRAVSVRCVRYAFGFDPDKLESIRAEVAELLDELPGTLHLGESFLNLCVTRYNEHWGGQRDIERLMGMAEALNLVRAPWARDKWSTLPGGMPVYIRCAIDPNHRSPLGIHPAWQHD